jgi:hypothetical protein
MAADLPSALLAFLHGEVKGADFRHGDHVRIGFEMLRRHGFLDAAQAYARGLKDIAARAGNPSAYHETITIAFLALIAERCATQDFANFEVFAAANPDLLDKAVLAKWYAPERLASAVARSTFILPERRA